MSDVLRRHPEVLSLSELFSQLYPFRFGAETVCTGAEVWRWLSEPNPLLSFLLRNGITPDELLYSADGRWFDPATGLPAVLATTLPHLDDDPDALYRRLADEVPTFDRRPVAQQFVRLAMALSRPATRVCVERSGSSLLFVEHLLRLFPAARVIHLHRAGTDTAWSMRAHPMYRLLYHLEQQVPENERSTDADGTLSSFREELTRWAAQLSPTVLSDSDEPLAWFGGLWSRMILRGLRCLRPLPGDRLMTVGYEHLVEQPEVVLREVARFLGLDPSAAWLKDAENRIRSPRGTARQRPTGPEMQRLRAACRPGARQLSRFLRGAPAWSQPAGDVPVM